MMDLWEVATEEERDELTGCFAYSVDMTEKETGTIELLPVIMSPPLFYSKGFELNPNLGAVLYEVTNYPDLYIRDFAVPRPSRKGENFRHTADASASA